jgi:flagellar L-ring protein precursor FlgH
MKNLIISLSFLFTLTSCGSFISGIHKDIDRENQNKGRRSGNKRRDEFSRFRKNRFDVKRNKLKNKISSLNNKNLPLKTKRKYSPEKEYKKRFTADDLTDNASDGSLWAGRDKNNYLFTLNTKKTNGDIVLIEVLDKLKREISLELKRAFPIRKKKGKPGEKADPKAAGAPPAEPAEDKGGPATKVHDKISSVIIEEINKDHILLHGRKYLLYKNRKRMIEIQALVNRKDVMDNDTVSSESILESSISVVR